MVCQCVPKGSSEWAMAFGMLGSGKRTKPRELVSQKNNDTNGSSCWRAACSRGSEKLRFLFPWSCYGYWTSPAVLVDGYITTSQGLITSLLSTAEPCLTKKTWSPKSIPWWPCTGKRGLEPLCKVPDKISVTYDLHCNYNCRTFWIMTFQGSWVFMTPYTSVAKSWFLKVSTEHSKHMAVILYPTLPYLQGPI